MPPRKSNGGRKAAPKKTTAAKAAPAEPYRVEAVRALFLTPVHLRQRGIARHDNASSVSTAEGNKDRCTRIWTDGALLFIETERHEPAATPLANVSALELAKPAKAPKAKEALSAVWDGHPGATPPPDDPNATPSGTPQEVERSFDPVPPSAA